MDIPLPGDSVIVLDSTQYASAWLGAAKGAIVRDLSEGSGTERVNHVVIDDDKVARFRDELLPSGPALRVQLTDFLRPLQARGRKPITVAVQTALQSGAKHVVLITGRGTVIPEAVADLRKQIEGARAKFSVLQVGEDVPALAALAESTGGTAKTVTVAELGSHAAGR